jgi:hypothetical protein
VSARERIGDGTHKTVGHLRAAIEELPDDAQMFINIPGHGEDYAIDEVWPSDQIPTGAWDWKQGDPLVVGLEIHLGLFTENEPPEGAS